MNVLILVIDSARADRLGCYGYARGTTPCLDDFAETALVYERMVTTAPWTVPSHASLFTGLYPDEHRAQHPVPIMRDDVTTLAGHLSAHGYRTAVVSCNGLVGPGTRIVAGFERCFYRRHFARSPRWVRRVTRLTGLVDKGARDANRFAAEWMARTARPFLLYMNYMECHWPYLPPKAYERKFSRNGTNPIMLGVDRVRRINSAARYAFGSADAERRAWLSDLYDGSLACADDRAGELLERLDGLGLSGNTVVVIMSDHGESLGEGGLGGHDGTLGQHLIHVPFMVRVPGMAPARVSGLTQVTDVFASLCRLLDVPVPPAVRDRLYAVDVFDLGGHGPRRPFAFSQWRRWPGEQNLRIRAKLSRHGLPEIPGSLDAVQDERYKLVLQNGDRPALYDLARDPEEQRDISTEAPEQMTRLQVALEQWRQACAGSAEAVYSAADEAAIERRLRDLGYL